jgi:adenosylcobinamide-GDP ribazoletransferase
MRSLLASLQFLTVIPVPVRLNEQDFERAPIWFPPVGLLLGVAVALGDLGLARLGASPWLLSIASVGLLAALSGGLHLDGLADTADGLLSARRRERALEIMRDSHIGTMGVLALIFVLALKVAALTELTGPARWRALVLAPLAGRCLHVAIMGLLPYAREEGGLADVFIRRRRTVRVFWAGLCLLAAGVFLFGLQSGLICVGLVIVIASLFSLWYLRRIGGFTGDTLGATSEIVEASVLIIVCLC